MELSELVFLSSAPYSRVGSGENGSDTLPLPEPVFLLII
jgi:hypothetical protein